MEKKSPYTPHRIASAYLSLFQRMRALHRRHGIPLAMREKLIRIDRLVDLGIGSAYEAIKDLEKEVKEYEKAIRS